MATWQQQLDEGKAAFATSPQTSLRGKSDGFRQGFYAASYEALQSKAGYTHKIAYDVYSKTLAIWVQNEFATFAPLLRKQRRDIVAQGGRNITIRSIAAVKGN